MVYLVKIVMFMHHSGNKLELLTYRVCDGVYTFFFLTVIFYHIKKKLTNVKNHVKKRYEFSQIFKIKDFHIFSVTLTS